MKKSNTLPCNLEAEVAVLGAILLNNDCFNQAAAVIAEEDFSLDSHRKIYRAISQLMERGKGVDFVTVSEQLGDAGTRECGGNTYITSLTDGQPRVKNISNYVSILREKAQLRVLVHMCTSALAAVRSGSKPEAVMSAMQQDIIDIFHKGRGSRTPEVPELVRKALEHLDTLLDMPNHRVGYTTGIASLDKLTTGFRNGEFYVVGARPGNGKSSFACQAIRANCLAGVKCALFTVEMSAQHVMERMAAMEGDVELFDLRAPHNLSPDELWSVKDGYGRVSEWPLLVDDSASIDVREIGALARMFISQGAQIIFVDYLQHVGAPGHTDFDRVTAVSEALCELAKATNVPVVALSQLRRADRRDAMAVPGLEDLRQSGQIEQDAHAVFLLHRPKGTRPAGDDAKDTETYFTGEDLIIIAKQRSGPAGKFVKVRFDGKRAMWEER